jgi:pre-mRNA-processing factor 19
MFQNEWDDVMLETHVIKQQLHATRKELSHALYQHDAACRVIARLVNERDEAQRLVAELQRSLAGKLTSEISSNRPNISKGELDPEVITRLTDFWKKTSRSRKKRPVSR